MARAARAVILYDHLETLLMANQLLDRVPSAQGRQTDWTVNSWQFNMLAWGCRLEAYRALEESVDVEVIVVAVGDSDAWAGLPMEWLVRWAEYRRRACSRLVVLTFGSAEAGASDVPTIAALRLLAESQALPFSVWRGAAPREDALGNPRTSATPMAEVSKENGSPTGRRIPA